MGSGNNDYVIMYAARYKLMKFYDCEMAQWVRVFSAKIDDLTLCVCVCADPPPHTHTQNVLKVNEILLSS